jgi:hypothetical protein
LRFDFKTKRRIRGLVTQGGRQNSLRPNVELVRTNVTYDDPAKRIFTPPAGDYSSEFITKYSIRYKVEDE